MIKWILPVALLLVGCGPREGHITGREFVPAHEMTTVTSSVDYDGDVSFETDTVEIPDTWSVTVTLDYTNFGTWDCSQADYNNATNGAWFRYRYGIIPEPAVEQ